MADVPQTALFVCFGGMSNVGTLTGLAGLEAMRRAKCRDRVMGDVVRVPARTKGGIP